MLWCSHRTAFLLAMFATALAAQRQLAPVALCPRRGIDGRAESKLEGLAVSRVTRVRVHSDGAALRLMPCWHPRQLHRRPKAQGASKLQASCRALLTHCPAVSNQQPPTPRILVSYAVVELAVLLLLHNGQLSMFAQSRGSEASDAVIPSPPRFVPQACACCGGCEVLLCALASIETFPLRVSSIVSPHLPLPRP